MPHNLLGLRLGNRMESTRDEHSVSSNTVHLRLSTFFLSTLQNFLGFDTVLQRGGTVVMEFWWLS